MDDRRILLVDDDPDLLQLLTWRLRAAGHHVTAVASGHDALSHIAVCPPHLVITDLRMAGMDGLELFNRIHDRYPSLPVIVLTAHGTIPEAVDAISRGAFSFLTKPFDGQELLACVTRALQITSVPSDSQGAWRHAILTGSPIMEELLTQAQLVAASDASVLIRGESGTGKELLARAIHEASPRRRAPFVAVNCSAIPEPLLESELFGHSKGSFTGAVQRYDGLLLSANHGTVFLDEIGDMPAPLQAKLLRVLQERQVRPVGSSRSVAIDVRVLSATHRDLEAAMQRREFREDLYYRLNVVCLRIPSLAERREDIPLLATHFLNSLSPKADRPAQALSAETLDLLITAAWPGNVRQLKNVIEQALVLSTGPTIAPGLVRRALEDKQAEALSLKEARQRFEQGYLVQVLRIASGNVADAARLAQRNRTEFYKLLRRHRLDPQQFKS